MAAADPARQRHVLESDGGVAVFTAAMLAGKALVRSVRHAWR